MRGFFISAAFLSCILLPAAAQEDDKSERLDSVVVAVSRAGRNTPVAYTMVGKRELSAAAPAKSVPMILAWQPSVVTTNEGGTGLGYSKMTVRGSKGSQINVTLNGITLNDSESQEVFWVNIPSLSNILGSVQLQRGLGTSANGAGAFGASINMNTSYVSSEPYTKVDLSAGSYNTFGGCASIGTGLSPHGFYVDALFSMASTKGYIRNAWANVYSIYGTGGWINGNNSLKFTVLHGTQHTGITWEGIPASKLATDRRYNPAGKYKDGEGNVCYYPDSDNYRQTHWQLNYTHLFNSPLVWSTTYKFTKGDGYYEQYKAGKEFSKYGMSGAGTADFLTNKNMDNGYHVVNTDLKYKTRTLDLAGGIYLASYTGNHFGNAVQQGIEDAKAFEWYRNKSHKREATAFLRAEYQPLKWLTTFADLQYRIVGLKMKGLDDEFSDLGYDTVWKFFNPRAGVSGRWDKHRAYASVAIGHREPGRSDLKEQIESVNALRAIGQEAEVTLRPEKMLDTEIGYEFSGKDVSASVNFYSMEYKDMLLETGKLSSSGYAIKENVDRSWRRGVEVSAAWNVSRLLSLRGNVTLSENKIKDYVYYKDTYDNSEDWNKQGKTEIHAGTVDMLMSPSVIAMCGLELRPLGGSDFRVVLDSKYVGKQYWDNTQTESLSIPSYFVADAFVEKSLDFNKCRFIIGAYCNNLFNRDYYADAWVYRAMFSNGDPEYIEEGLFPQALRNFSFKLRMEF